MKKMKKFLCVILFLILPSFLFGKQYFFQLENVGVRAKVTYKDGKYYYTYFVKNENTEVDRGIGVVGHIWLDLTIPSNAYSLPSKGLVHGPWWRVDETGWVCIVFGEKMLPFSVTFETEVWRGRRLCKKVNRKLGYERWSCDDPDWDVDYNGYLIIKGTCWANPVGENYTNSHFWKGNIELMPGEYLEFTLITYGIPVVRRIKFNSDVSVADLLDHPDKAELFYTESRLYDLEPDELKWYKTYTIGPTSPTRNFSFTEFVRDMENNLSKVQEFRWIRCKNGKEKHLCGKFRRYLENIISLYKREDIDGAKNEIINAMNFISSNGCQDYHEACDEEAVFRSEAYGLFYYDLDFLLRYLSNGGDLSRVFEQ